MELSIINHRREVANAILAERRGMKPGYRYSTFLINKLVHMAGQMPLCLKKFA